MQVVAGVAGSEVLATYVQESCKMCSALFACCVAAFFSLSLLGPGCSFSARRGLRFKTAQSSAEVASQPPGRLCSELKKILGMPNYIKRTSCFLLLHPCFEGTHVKFIPS